MTKICIVGPSKKFFGGVSAYTVRLANALAVQNEVTALLLRNLLPKFLYPGKDHVGRYNPALKFVPDIRAFEGMDWDSPLSWSGAYRFLNKERPDVIIMQWWTSSVAHMELLIAWMNRLKSKSRLILEMHEVVDPLEASRPFFRLYSRLTGSLITGMADGFLAHSAVMKEQITRTYRLPEEKVFVVPHGVYDIYAPVYSREAARRELGINEPFVILYFGLIRKYKGVPCLVEAFNRLPEAIAGKSRLIIAGEDWGDEKGLAAMIKQSPYNGQIMFRPGFVPDSGVPLYFAAADVVGLPYLRTSGSGVTSLAVAFGKQVIISDLEETRESLRDYGGAVFVPRGDAPGLAAKIAELYDRKKSGSDTPGYSVPPEKTWEYVAGEYGKIINRVMQG